MAVGKKGLKKKLFSVNYPVLRQNKCVLLNSFEKNQGRKVQHCTSIWEAMYRGVNPYEKVATFTSFFVYTRTLL